MRHTRVTATMGQPGSQILVMITIFLFVWVPCSESRSLLGFSTNFRERRDAIHLNADAVPVLLNNVFGKVSEADVSLKPDLQDQRINTQQGLGPELVNFETELDDTTYSFSSTVEPDLSAHDPFTLSSSGTYSSLVERIRQESSRLLSGHTSETLPTSTPTFILSEATTQKSLITSASDRSQSRYLGRFVVLPKKEMEEESIRHQQPEKEIIFETTLEPLETEFPAVNDQTETTPVQMETLFPLTETSTDFTTLLPVKTDFETTTKLENDEETESPMNTFSTLFPSTSGMFDRSPRISDDVDIENLDDENQSLREGNDEKNIFDGFYHEENPGQYEEEAPGTYHETTPGQYKEDAIDVKVEVEHWNDSRIYNIQSKVDNFIIGEYGSINQNDGQTIQGVRYTAVDDQSIDPKLIYETLQKFFPMLQNHKEER